MASPPVSARRSPAWRRPAWRVTAAAAVLAGAIGVAAWLNGQRAPSPPDAGIAPAEEPVAVPETGAPVAFAPPKSAVPPSRTDLARLAAIVPAPYEPLLVRGAESSVRQEFRRAMETYRAGDFDAARPALERAHAVEPGAPDIAFFLGVVALLFGHDETGIAVLRATVALGGTSWRQEALLYLGKAFVRRGDLAAAREQFLAVESLDGDLAGDARRLLDALPRSP